ncbi:MAG TPA: 2-oxoglutarate dehydrogenase E1 component [Xanthobacteraceae bacterium]|nr:2-oxoglutarate dehydrogenase E1 component [Xanthobacteraceae bacterium]
MARADANQNFLNTSFLYGANGPWIEDLYARYEADPNAVDAEWQAFFGALKEERTDVEKNARGASWKREGWPLHANGELVSALDGHWIEVEKTVGDKVKAKAQTRGVEISTADVQQATRDSVKALMMIRAYRMRGHLHAKLDPLGLEPVRSAPELDPASYGFREADLDRPIFIDHVLGLEFATVRQMTAILQRTYCQTLGVEFMHISAPDEKAWIQERIEGPDKEISFTREGKRAILNKLVEAEGFEKFIDVRYTGTKRFGLDGSESLIPALEQIIKRGGNLGVKEIAFGMAHRGRLNVLTQVMGKPHRALFHEFKGGSWAPDEVEGSGDVKYHLGASSDREFDGNRVHLSLTANPSHLEIVDPVVLGKCRAKQDGLGDTERSQVLPLLLHGDAAFAGQGVVAECFGLSGLKGHQTGGSLHFIINNQIGFTTYPRFSRSSPYPSDVAKVIEAPIFHVNGDDPEAVTFAAKIATEFRQRFHKPVVIDMFCYRRFGHNEGDEPAFTQPLMYKAIKQHPTTLEIYARKLESESVIEPGEFDRMRAEWRAKLDAEYEAGQHYRPNKADWLDGRWAGLKTADDDEDPRRRGDTGLSLDVLRDIGTKITKVPGDFHVHRTIQRFLDARAKTILQDGTGIDWSTGEALAYCSLLIEGHPVRLSGQDSERGTFSQRHSVLTDQETEARYTPFNYLRDGQSRYEVINSMLSEEAVLGFEYGYSLSDPNALVLWEAQFGDFANGAQVIFDQFLSSGERKWLRMSGLVCLLPHGYEGQGPEHSSARLERFLQMCAEDNMQVANCTTPANLFHILRRQLKRDFRKPLILMTPKSLLRHKRATSALAEMGPGTSFHRLLWDDADKKPGAEGITLKPDAEIKRVVLCSGKVYFDLFEERERRGVDDIYLLRVEQLFPFPLKSMVNELSRFKQAEIVWCQEEPKNQGAWAFVQPYLEWVLEQVGSASSRPRYAGRPASAATATGLMSKHLAQLKTLLADALG